MFLSDGVPSIVFVNQASTHTLQASLLVELPKRFEEHSRKVNSMFSYPPPDLTAQAPSHLHRYMLYPPSPLPDPLMPVDMCQTSDERRAASRALACAVSHIPQRPRVSFVTLMGLAQSVIVVGLGPLSDCSRSSPSQASRTYSSPTCLIQLLHLPGLFFSTSGDPADDSSLRVPSISTLHFKSILNFIERLCSHHIVSEGFLTINKSKMFVLHLCVSICEGFLLMLKEKKVPSTLERILPPSASILTFGQIQLIGVINVGIKPNYFCSLEHTLQGVDRKFSLSVPLSTSLAHTHSNLSISDLYFLFLFQSDLVSAVSGLVL